MKIEPVSRPSARPVPVLMVLVRGARAVAGAFLLAAALGGCATLVPQTMALRDAWPAGVALKTEMADTPFFAQLEYQCGPAALATILVQSGVSVTPDELVKQVYLPARQGSLQVEMLAASRRHARVAYTLAPRFDDLLREVAAGNPVVVLQDLGFGPIAKWHYAVVIGYDYAAGELYLRSGETKRLAIPFTTFEFTWKKGGYWAMVALPPGRIPATATEAEYLAAILAMERVGDAAVATPAYAAFLARWPDNLAASVGLANRYHARGALEEAAVILQRSLTRHPDSVVLMNNLAQTLSDLGRNDEALTLIERAARPGAGQFSAAISETHALIRQRMAAGR